MSKRRKKRFRAQLAKSLSKNNSSSEAKNKKVVSIKKETSNLNDTADIKKDLRLISYTAITCLIIVIIIWLIDRQTLHIENISKSLMEVFNIGG